MDLVTLAMAKPKCIDLAAYIGSDGTTKASFGMFILASISVGGGSTTLSGGNVAEFWKAIATEKPIKVKMVAGDLPIYTQAVTVVHGSNGSAVQLAFNVTMYNSDLGGVVDIAVTIHYEFGAAVITVKVT